MVNDTIQVITDTLRIARPTARLILLGSRARGDNSRESDFDILVIEDLPQSRYREMVFLSDLLRPLRVPVDVVVVSRAVFRETSKTPGTLYYAAATEGRLLYEPT
jgi:predicted nucleotidyltransferase